MENEGFAPYNTDYATENIALPKMKSSKIDYELVEKLASFGLNREQIAIAIKIRKDKFIELSKSDEKLNDAIDRGKSKLKLNILAGQLRIGLPDPENGYIGNASMLKHLGMVHLNQAEKSEVDIREDIHVTLTWGNKKIEIDKKDEDKQEI